MHYFKTVDVVLRTAPQLLPPPFLAAPPFTSPVGVKGKLYIAQEIFGIANKQMLAMMRLRLLDARTRPEGHTAWWSGARRVSAFPLTSRFPKDRCHSDDSRKAVESATQGSSLSSQQLRSIYSFPPPSVQSPNSVSS